MTGGPGWRPVWALCVSQLISWGTLYYAFGILQAPIAAATGWSQEALTGAFSLGLLLTGVSTFAVGVLLRRVSGRLVMTVGSALAGVCLAAMGGCRELWQFYVVWAVTGLAMGATLYETAFAVLARLYDADYQKALTMITLAGGMASTVFWPLTGVLATAFGWRECCAGYGLLQWLVCVPLHWLALPGGTTAGAAGPGRHWRQEMGALVRRPEYQCLAVSFMLHAVVFSALSVHLVPLLQARGLGLGAATALAALAGPVQVLGRGLQFRWGAQWPITRTANVAQLLVVVALGLLLWPAGPLVALGAAVALYGASNGVMTIVRGVSIRERFGAAQYAAASGALMGPAILCRAAGPLLAALVLSYGEGYEPVIGSLGVLAGISWVSYARAMSGGRARGI